MQMSNHLTLETIKRAFSTLQKQISDLTDQLDEAKRAKKLFNRKKQIRFCEKVDEIENMRKIVKRRTPISKRCHQHRLVSRRGRKEL